MSDIDEQFMRLALKEAFAAEAVGEVPVGALVVLENEIIGRGHNRVINNCDPTAHAEILAMRDAALHLDNYRLSGSVLYTTIEPCAMCAGAMIHARISKLVYGAVDPRAGAVDTFFHICTTDFLNHQIMVQSGVLEDECRSMLQSFFRKKRETAERCESG